MAALSQESDEHKTMKKIANAKTNKEKAKVNRVLCSCACKRSSAQALSLWDKGIPIYTINEEIEKNGKIFYQDIIYSSCIKYSLENEKFCKTHLNAYNDDPSKIVMLDDIKNNPSVRLIKDRDDELLNKRKGKKATPKKNRFEIPKRIVENEEAYEKFMNIVNNGKTQILQELNQAEFSGNVTSKPKAKSESPKKKINKKQVQEEVDDSEEEEEQDEEIQEEIDINESDEEDEDDEIEFEDDFWETSDGREFLKVKDEMIIYSPEEKSEPFAELIEVSDEDAPFNPKNDEYYIAGQTMEIKSKNYVICKITDFAYDSDLNKVGKAKKNKSGVYINIKKC